MATNLLTTFRQFPLAFIHAEATLPYLLSSVIFVFTIGAASVVLCKPASRERIIHRGLAIWIVSLSFFLLFFAVGLIRYKILLFAALFALAATLGTQSRRVDGIWALTLLALLVLNGLNLWPAAARPSVNSDLMRIAWLRRVLQPQDFFLFAGTHNSETVTNVALRYFMPVPPARSLRGYYYEHYDARDFAPLDQLMQATWQHHGQVYVEEPVYTGTATISQTDAGSSARWLKTFRVKKKIAGPNGYTILQVARRK